MDFSKPIDLGLEATAFWPAEDAFNEFDVIRMIGLMIWLVFD